MATDLERSSGNTGGGQAQGTVAMGTVEPVNSRSRRWAWTINNPTQEDIDRLNSSAFMPPVSYLLWGRERGQQGTEHFQGYLECSSRVRFATVKSILGPRAHVEVAIADADANVAYCKKDGTDIHEYGSVYRPPKNQWEAIRAFELQGDIESIKDHFIGTFHRCRSSILEECLLHKVPVTWDGNLQTKNFIFCGPTGVGKSKKVREMAQELGVDVYDHLTKRWWDGYNGQGIVVVEDLDPDQCKGLAHHLKKWMDRYSFTAEVKGGSVMVNPAEYKFIITTQYTIDELFPRQQDRDAIRRRCQVVMMTDLRQ